MVNCQNLGPFLVPVTRRPLGRVPQKGNIAPYLQERVNVFSSQNIAEGDIMIASAFIVLNCSGDVGQEPATLTPKS